MPTTYKQTVAVLTATMLNISIALSLLIYQLCSMGDFEHFFLRHAISSPLFCNVFSMGMSIIAIVLLFSKATAHIGHMMYYLFYLMIICCGIFTYQVSPHLYNYYFSVDTFCLVVLGLAVCYAGFGFTLRSFVGFHLRLFSFRHVKSHFTNSVFVADRRTLLSSLLITFLLFTAMALLFLKQPLSNLFFLFGINE